MNSNQLSTKPSRHPKKLIFLIAALGFLGFADSAYLTAEHYFKLPLPCSLTQGCDIVLTSKYSQLGPLPIAIFGALYYLAVLALAVHLLTEERAERKYVFAVLNLTTVGVLTSSVLTYLQVFVIGSLCLYCLGSAAISLLLFISSIFLVRKTKSSIARA